MAGRPGVSLPEMFRASSYEMNASYDLLKRKEATPDNLQSAHRRRTRERCAAGGPTLLGIEDTSDMSYSGGKKIEGLGAIGNGKSEKYQGFQLHSVLAVRVPVGGLASETARRAPLEICGLLDQQYLVREKKKNSRKRLAGGEGLESQRWIESVRRTADACSGQDVRRVRVADREGDFYEYLIELINADWSFVVRAYHNRRLQDEETGLRCGHCFDEARAAPPLGSFVLSLRRRGSVPAREARLSVSVVNDVLLQSPQRPGAPQGALAPVRVSIVRVWEENPPAHVAEPLEWILLSSEGAETFEQAREIALQYSCRWIIEEFHKALKTGMGAEELQLEHGDRLMAAVAVMSVVALRLIDTRERARLLPDAPARENGFDETDLQILRKTTGKAVSTVREAMRAMAKLGGFLGRKGDGEPGMITLWRGLRTLQLIKEGFLLGIAITSGPKSQE